MKMKFFCNSGLLMVVINKKFHYICVVKNATKQFGARITANGIKTYNPNGTKRLLLPVDFQRGFL